MEIQNNFTVVIIVQSKWRLNVQPQRLTLVRPWRCAAEAGGTCMLSTIYLHTRDIFMYQLSVELQLLSDMYFAIV